MNKLKISAVIITRDDRKRVKALTEKLLEFLSEVVVLVDDRSEDDLVDELQLIDGCVLDIFTRCGRASR